MHLPVKKWTALFLGLTLALSALPCRAEPAEAQSVTVEAESGTLLGGARVGSSGDTAWVENLARGGDGFSVVMDVPADGFYDLVVRSDAQGSHKENYVDIDGARAGAFASDGRGFADSALRRLRLTAGPHEIAVTAYWGWIRVDSLTLAPSQALPEDLYEVQPVLADPEASPNARRLMTYLCDIYGEKILSGQYCDQGMYGMENAAIWRVTGGSYPALLGLDMIEYTPSRVERGAQGRSVEYARDYWEKGGISTFCWHWNAPTPYITGQWYSAFYTEHTSMNLGRIMEGEDAAGYELLLRDIDAISEAMRPLAEADVPILWRPLHEASGGWFWWGASGAQAYIDLYRLMYERMTVENGLHNLIWVWNGQSADWYPGDDVVDIIGWDIYPGEHVYTSQAETFLQALACTPARKMIILSENGCVPDPDELFADRIIWGSWCTWGGEFVLKSAGFNQMSEVYTEKDMILKVYGDDRVVKRADLPDIASYPTAD